MSAYHVSHIGASYVNTPTHSFIHLLYDIAILFIPYVWMPKTTLHIHSQFRNNVFLGVCVCSLHASSVHCIFHLHRICSNNLANHLIIGSNASKTALATHFTGEKERTTKFDRTVIRMALAWWSGAIAERMCKGWVSETGRDSIYEQNGECDKRMSGKNVAKTQLSTFRIATREPAIQGIHPSGICHRCAVYLSRTIVD